MRASLIRNRLARASVTGASVVEHELGGDRPPVSTVLRKWLGTRRALVVFAALVVGIELYATASNSAWTLGRIGYQHLSRPSRLTRDADLDPLAFYAPTGALLAAQQTIPRGATYTIVVGNDPPGANPDYVRILFKLWLVPRLYTERLSEAHWVIAYHHSSETLGVKYTKEIGLGPDVNVVEVTP